ncbi:MAG: 23S rRNA (pseudouridine(1915)-N(3))-methyltransferase RlmH [Erysipelotrichaceae bacterium]|nr:23S rRNA (pseudouridine(1915)-N(3))-methyltransferase RlmH [Erysipelotrichaceae bacterium]
MIKIVAVGKCREKALLALIKEYEKRLGAFAKIEIIEVADEMAPQSLSTAQMMEVKRKEGERLLARLKPSDHVILLDLAGHMIDSVKLAEKIHNVQTYGGGDIAFVIGGSLGISEAVIQRSDWRWKLSDLTFPHQMVRLLVCEQVYRAFTILHHQPYHK